MSQLDAFILAAGLGTRMGPLSLVLPKPAWPLRGRPLVLWGADAFRRAGLLRVGCNAHHQADLLRASVAEEVEVFDEPQLLGSSGGLRHALGHCADPLAVWNGDAIAEVPWGAFLAEHRRRGAELSWLLVPHPGGPWNPVWLGSDGRILPQGQTGLGPYHFTGASLWSPAALALLPEGPSDTKADLLPHLHHHAGIVVESFPWVEIGTPDQLIAAAAQLAPEEEGRFPGCYLHPGASALGFLRRCVLGPGVHLGPEVEDRDALWFVEEGHLRRLGLDCVHGSETAGRP